MKMRLKPGRHLIEMLEEEADKSTDELEEYGYRLALADVLDLILSLLGFLVFLCSFTFGSLIILLITHR